MSTDILLKCYKYPTDFLWVICPNSVTETGLMFIWAENKTKWGQTKTAAAHPAVIWTLNICLRYKHDDFKFVFVPVYYLLYMCVCVCVCVCFGGLGKALSCCSLPLSWMKSVILPIRNSSFVISQWNFSLFIQTENVRHCFENWYFHFRLCIRLTQGALSDEQIYGK